MKIHIRVLAFAIMCFHTFDELNASGTPGASSSSGSSCRGPVIGIPNEVVSFKYKGFRIQGKVDYFGTALAEAKLLDIRNDVPTGNDYIRRNYAFYLGVVDKYEFVVYRKKDFSIMGVRALKLTGFMEPDAKTWYIAHARHIFVVIENLETGRVDDIYRWPNNTQPISNLQHCQNREQVIGYGVQFLMYKSPNDEIMAAEVDPTWVQPILDP